MNKSLRNKGKWWDIKERGIWQAIGLLQNKPCLCVIDHQLRTYNACSWYPYAYDEINWRYIGFGYIRMVQGKVQSGKKHYYHFWVKR